MGGIVIDVELKGLDRRSGGKMSFCLFAAQPSFSVSMKSHDMKIDPPAQFCLKNSMVPSVSTQHIKPAS